MPGGGRYALAPLVVFMAFSSLIMLWPTLLSLDASSIQSLTAIQHLPLFVLCMFVWAGTLVVAGWHGQRSPWCLASLTGVMAIVLLTFWTIHRPNGIYEEPAKLADAVWIQFAGGVRQNILVGYLAWPGTAFLAASVASVTGLPLIAVAAITVIVTAGSLGILLLIFTNVLIHDPWLAFLVTVIALVGNIWIMLFSFHPDYIGLTMLAAALVLAARSMMNVGGVAAERAGLITVGLAATITHLMTALLLPCLIVAFWLARQKHRQTDRPGLSLSTALLLIIIPLAWTLYWSVTEFTVLTKGLSQMLQIAQRGDFSQFYFYIGGIATANVEKVPTWVNFVRLGWLGGLYGVGIVLALAAISTWREREPSHLFVATGLLAVAVFTGFATISGIGGVEYFRFIAYGSLFASPVLGLWLLRLRRAKLVATALAGLVVLALAPTFLADNARVSDSAYYGWEFSAARFIQARTPVDASVYDPGASWSTVLYERPTAVIVTPAFEVGSISRGFGAFRSTMQDQVRNFIRGRSPDHAQVFLMTDKFAAVYAHQWGLPVADQLQRELEQDLQATNLVYDAGKSKLYD